MRVRRRNPDLPFPRVPSFYYKVEQPRLRLVPVGIETFVRIVQGLGYLVSERKGVDCLVRR